MKKYVAIILIGLIFTANFVVAGIAPILHVQTPAGGSDAGSVSSTTVAFGSNTIAGNAILVTCSWGALARIPTITDTAGNTYIVTGTSTNATDNSSTIFAYSTNIVGGADTVKCAVSGAASILRLQISEFSGIKKVSPIDTFATSSGTGSNPASGSITPIVNGSLLYAYERNASAANIVAGTDFTLTTRVPNTTSARMAAEYYVQPVIASHTGDFTPTQTNWAAGIVVLKPEEISTPFLTWVGVKLFWQGTQVFIKK